MKIIILAAGQGTRLKPITDEVPKCMVTVEGKSILDRQLDVFRRNGVLDKNIVVVCGYKGDVLRERYSGTEIRFIDNAEYRNTNMVYSLMCAEDVLKSENDVVISYGDIFYEDRVFKKICDADSDYNVVVDRLWLKYWSERFANPLDDAESLTMDKDGYIIDIGKKVQRIEQIQAQYIGLVKFRKKAIDSIISIYNQDIICNNPQYRKMYMTDLIQKLVDCGKYIKGISIERGWFEIDSYKDLALVERYLKAQTV